MTQDLLRFRALTRQPTFDGCLFHALINLDHHAVKKNNRKIMRNRRTGRSFLGKSDKLQAAEYYLTNALILEKKRRQGFETIIEPVWCLFLFTFPKSEYFVQGGARKGHLSKRIPDLSNLYQLPEDCLQKAQVIENDSQICAHDFSRKIPGDKHQLEIFIFKFNHELELQDKP